MKKIALALLLSSVISVGILASTNVQAVTVNSNNANTKKIVSMRESRPTLRLGSKNSYVTYVQENLLQCGFYKGRSFTSDKDRREVIDGKYGTETKNAVIAFQRWANIKDDGVVGPETWAVMDRSFS